MTTLTLPARLTIAEARATLAQLQQGLGAAAADVAVDCSALKELDSAALAVLLECRRSTLARGKVFALQHVPAKLTDLARLYGIQSLLDGS